MTLHHELLGMYRLLAPTSEEDSRRDEFFEHMKGILNGVYPSAELVVFGSHRTKLYLPSSDIDLIVLIDSDTESDVDMLTKIGTCWLYQWYVYMVA